jgi:hypothetical protein
MVTTYQINSENLDVNLINMIKSNFPNQDVFIDVYNDDEIKMDFDTITNSEIIDRIIDIKANKNIIVPDIIL